jgi:hypothetical protein
MYRQYGYAVSPRLERIIDLHCNAHFESALYAVPFFGISSSVFSPVLIDEVVCILESVSHGQNHMPRKDVLLGVVERIAMENGLIGFKYLYIHSRADAANCLLERAALNRVPKARWLPNSSQMRRIISGGNIGAMTLKILRFIKCKMMEKS